MISAAAGAAAIRTMVGNKQSIDYFAKEHGIEDKFIPSILYLIFDDDLNGNDDDTGIECLSAPVTHSLRTNRIKESTNKNHLYQNNPLWDTHVQKCIHKNLFHGK
jgi:hypothetical protein